MRRAVLISSLFLAVACAREKTDVETICRTTPSPHAQDANEWMAIDRALDDLATKMRSDEGKRLVARMRESASDPASLLSTQAKRVGVDPCPFADTLNDAEERARYRHDVELLCGWTLDQIPDGSILGVEGRALRDRLSRLSPADRAATLRSESKRVGLAGCSLADAK